MLTAKTVTVTSSAAVKLTQGITLDEPLVAVIQLEAASSGSNPTICIGDANVGPSAGYRLTAPVQGESATSAPAVSNPFITIPIQGDDIYAATSLSSVTVDVLFYSPGPE